MFQQEPSRKKKYTPAQAFLKISGYCAYQERSHKEVRNKLFDYGLYGSEVEEMLTRLITEGFLNEERFAKAFAGGKFRMKKWGRNKIAHELEAHAVTGRCIQKGLDEIDDREYTKVLRTIIEKKWSQVADENAFRRKDKVARFAIGKGYESSLVWAILKEMKG
jgi:regulatory protein